MKFEKSPDELVTNIKPKTLTINNVCYWYESTGRLLGTQKSKARKFIENRCIRQIDDFYLCLPIEGYNKTTHKVRINPDTCSCQFFIKNNLECSHIKAVKLFKFMRLWNENL